MKHFILFAATLFFVGFLTSCQKENIESLTPALDSSASVTDRNPFSANPNPPFTKFNETWDLCGETLYVTFAAVQGSKGIVVVDETFKFRFEAQIVAPNGMLLKMLGIDPKDVAVCYQIVNPKGGDMIIQLTNGFMLQVNATGDVVCKGQKL